MDEHLIRRMAVPAPRYTSYPMAPHFDDGVDPGRYEVWPGAVPPDATLSAHVHVPFCRTMCWYCGCETRATRRYDPAARPFVRTLASRFDAYLGAGRARHSVGL